MTPAQQVRVAFVGAGRMGRPMVDRLRAAGHDVVVHARGAEAREALRQDGVQVTAHLAEAADGADLAVVCVFSDAQLREVGPPLVDALPAGSALASHVTGSPDLVRDLAEQGRPRGVAVHDAPVSGTADDVAAGRLTVLLGGDAGSAARCASVLGAYADPVVPTGALGSALAVKLVNNLLFAATLQLLADAARLGRALGVDEPALVAALAHCSGRSHAVEGAVRRGLEVYGRSTEPFLRKDVSACRETAQALGVDPGLLLQVVRAGAFDLDPADG